MRHEKAMIALKRPSPFYTANFAWRLIRRSYMAVAPLIVESERIMSS